MKHIRNIISDNKCALMCIHSPELALEYCDRILLMKDGKIVSDIDVHVATVDNIVHGIVNRHSVLSRHLLMK